MSDSPRGSEAGPPDEEGAGSGVRTFLIADVRGYTHFTQAHGDEAAAQLAGAFASTTRAVAARCGGAVIELRGDEALVVFASARQALRAAVELQEEFAGGSGDAPALPLGVGIGVDAGEAVPLEQGYRGGALNLAARLCANARAGEVLASEGVTHLSGRVQGLEFRDPVWLRVKGLPRPMRAYQVVREGAARVKRRRRPAEVSARRRWTWIAVTGALVAAAAGALVFAAQPVPCPRTRSRVSTPTSAGAIDPGNNRLVDQVRVGAGPGRMADGVPVALGRERLRQHRLAHRPGHRERAGHSGRRRPDRDRGRSGVRLGRVQPAREASSGSIRSSTGQSGAACRSETARAASRSVPVLCG